MMPARILLFLGAGQIDVCCWKNGILAAAQHFSNDPDGHGQIAAFLQTRRGPVYLLADFIEEDFRYETVPHLHGSNRTALLQRRFEQYYRNTPFRQATLQRRRKDGRRDDEMLFSALTNPTLVLPLLQTLQAHGIAVAGIYSVPGISTPLVKDIASEHLLLLSWEKHAGLRQTYFHGKRLYFSRLTPLGQGNAFGAVIAAETALTQQYLKGLGLLAHNQALDIFIVCHAHDRRALQANLHGNPALRYGYLDIQELGQRIGSTTALADSDATPLFLHLLAARPPRSNYAAAVHTHLFRLQQVRRGLHGLGATLAAAGLLWSAVNLWDAGRLHADSAALRMQASQVAQQVQQIKASLPDTSSAAADMKAAALLLRKLDILSPPPQQILAELGATLDVYTQIRVEKLAWQTSAASGARAADSTTAPLSAQTILLSGELEGLAGDYRGALDYLARFQQALMQHGHDVTALALPLDISPAGRISGDAAGDRSRPAQFSLKIVWKPKT